MSNADLVKFDENTSHNIEPDCDLKLELERQKTEIMLLQDTVAKCNEELKHLKNEVEDVSAESESLIDKFNYLNSECKFQSDSACFQTGLIMIIINIICFTAHYVACHV